MQVLRTPEERFARLPGYPFEPRYIDADTDDGATLRVHYVDEGPREAETLLLLHGEPSWSYLYRRMIPVLVEAGLRAVAPDLVGFGRSDKPAERNDYTYQRHVDWIRAVVERLDLRGVTLVGQDWGGLIGLRLVAEDSDRFARVVAANTFLPTGDMAPGKAFLKWQTFSQEIEEFPVGRIVARGCSSDPPDEILRAYDAPFPDESFKAGARQFPMLVPIHPDDPASEPNRTAWATLSQWRKPFVTIFGADDAITRGADRFLQAAVPGCEGQPHAVLEDAGHYIQEDKGEELAGLIVEFIERNPQAPQKAR